MTHFLGMVNFHVVVLSVFDRRHSEGVAISPGVRFLLMFLCVLVCRRMCVVFVAGYRTFLRLPAVAVRSVI